MNSDASDKRAGKPARGELSLTSPVPLRTARSRISSNKKQRMNHERRALLMTLASGTPAMLVALVLLWTGDYTAKVFWTLAALLVGCWLGFAFALQDRIVRPLQTISNLLAALREDDFSIRARGATHTDALGEVLSEVNALSETLREQRLGALEATVLLRTVMAEIDVAVFAFDDDERLRLVNRAGERLLAQPSERIIGRTAGQLLLSECLVETNGDAINGAAHTIRKTFPGDTNRRWGVRHSAFRAHGRPHHLLVIADLSRPLREEESAAWQRLVRVLGHELNNSLAPIKSLAGSLATLLTREPRPADWQDDMKRGLAVVAARAESLTRFMDSYARLSRLPPPTLKPLDVDSLIRRVIVLETRLNVELVPGPKLTIDADGDQLEQLLINLIRNAVDAATVTGGGVQIGWSKNNSHVEVWVEDEGLGLANTANLFVPFFTTKPQGSGIGLVLSRQIAEAHGGTLTLENKRYGKGCEARLYLPL